MDFMRVFEKRRPQISDLFCVADGLKVMLDQSGDVVIQNLYYNRWTHDHYVSNVFVSTQNERIILFSLNAPGCLHDSTVAGYGNVCKDLESVLEHKLG